MIRERTPQEQAALHFKAAGLGPASAREAARIMRHTGVSFETAAVLGQRTGEDSTATAATIREEADRYLAARTTATTTAWGRPLSEGAGPARVTAARGPAKTPVPKAQVPADAEDTSRVSEAPRATLSAFGRPIQNR